MRPDRRAPLKSSKSHKELAQEFLLSMRSRFTIVWYGSDAFYMDFEPCDGLLEAVEGAISKYELDNPNREARIVLAEMKRAVRDAQPNCWRIKASGRYLMNCDLDAMDSPNINQDLEMTSADPKLTSICINLYRKQFLLLGLEPPATVACAFRRTSIHEVPIRFLQNESLVDGFIMDRQLS